MKSLFTTTFVVSFFLTSFSNAQTQPPLSEQSQIFTARDKIMPALVHVEPVKEIYSEGKKQKRSVTGSGIIFSKEGYVITNNHVAENATKVNCVLSNKEEISAEVIGTDPYTDIAVLKLNPKGLKSPIVWAELGKSSNLQVGQTVLAFGSPLGFSRSLSIGVISSIDRYFEDFGDFISPYNLWIQTDAAINPGNSGGPLVNIEGQVIGINSRGIRQGENLGFAIPIDIVYEVAKQIIDFGEVKRSWIGLNLQNLKDFEEVLNLKNTKGVLVASVEEDSPAFLAGILPQDVITSFDSVEVSARFKEELPEINKLMADTEIGKTVKIQALRQGKQFEFILTTTKKGKYDEKEFEFTEWGFSAKQLSQRLARKLKVSKDYGILVTGLKTGSLAQKSHLEQGSLILSVDGQDVSDLESFKEIYDKILRSKTERTMLLTEQNKSRKFVLITKKR
ncbi:trypsin-like peptidase domain-containing protein [bacterium]|nr:trypsin-like peptidase domain-containing protein [bacterium]